MVGLGWLMANSSTPMEWPWNGRSLKVVCRVGGPGRSLKVVCRVGGTVGVVDANE